MAMAEPNLSLWKDSENPEPPKMFLNIEQESYTIQRKPFPYRNEGDLYFHIISSSVLKTKASLYLLFNSFVSSLELGIYTSG